MPEASGRWYNITEEFEVRRSGLPSARSPGDSVNRLLVLKCFLDVLERRGTLTQELMCAVIGL